MRAIWGKSKANKEVSNDTKSGQFALENCSWKIGIICKYCDFLFVILWYFMNWGINTVWAQKMARMKWMQFKLFYYCWKVTKTSKFYKLYVCNFWAQTVPIPSMHVLLNKMLRKPGFFQAINGSTSFQVSFLFLPKTEKFYPHKVIRYQNTYVQTEMKNYRHYDSEINFNASVSWSQRQQLYI